MKKQIASLDTSFWINAHQAGIVPETIEYFDIYVAEGVADETRRPLISGRESLAASFFNRCLEERMLQLKNPEKAVNLLMLDKAIEDYVEKKLDLASAAHEAGISVREFMGHLERRGLAVMESEEMFWEGLRTLSETFGASEILKKLIA